MKSSNYLSHIFSLLHLRGLTRVSEPRPNSTPDACYDGCVLNDGPPSSPYHTQWSESAQFATFIDLCLWSKDCYWGAIWFCYFMQ